jgi:hypothetical protein
MPKICFQPGCIYAVFSKGLCKNHWRSSEFKKSFTNKNSNKIYSEYSIKKIKLVSPKQKVRLAEYKKVRSEYLAEHPACEAKVKCGGAAADQIHHKAGRIGTRLTDKANFLAVCPECHIWIEAFPALAKKAGFSKSRLDIAN